MNSEFTIAVHGLVYLANIPGHMASSEDIANNVCTNPARVRKVMSCLKQAGFVDTKEGTGGGYVLSQNPDHLSLGDIYRASSMGQIKPNWCSGDVRKPCIVSSNIETVMNDIFARAEDQLLRFFTTISIADVLSMLRREDQLKA